MSTFLYRVKSLGTELTDGLSERFKHALEGASSEEQEEPQPETPSPTPTSISINVETATDEELRQFIRRQASHIGRLEGKCREVIEAYKRLSLEKSNLMLQLNEDRLEAERLQHLYAQEREAKEALSQQLDTLNLASHVESTTSSQDSEPTLFEVKQKQKKEKKKNNKEKKEKKDQENEEEREIIPPTIPLEEYQALEQQKIKLEHTLEAKIKEFNQYKLKARVTLEQTAMHERELAQARIQITQLEQATGQLEEKDRRIEQLESEIAERAADVVRLEDAQKAMVEAHALALERLEGTHEEAAHSLRGEWRQEVATLEAAHVEKTLQLTLRHRDEMKALEKAHQEALSHQQALEKMIQQHRQEVRDLEMAQQETLQSLTHSISTPSLLPPSASPSLLSSSSSSPSIVSSVFPPPSSSSSSNLVYTIQLNEARTREQLESRSQILDLTSRLQRAQIALASQDVARKELEAKIDRLRRDKKPDNLPYEYLKNIILKLIEFPSERDKLIPVLAMLLQFSPLEVERLKMK